jgi:hypothetical protein
VGGWLLLQVRAFFDYVRELMELEALDLPSSSLVLPGDSEVQMDHLLEVTANLPPHLRTELMEHLSKGVVQAEVLVSVRTSQKHNGRLLHSI